MKRRQPLLNWVRKIRLPGRTLIAGMSNWSARISTARLDEVTMTSNGLLLPTMPSRWWAGLSRLNISIDSLNPDRFRELTG